MTTPTTTQATIKADLASLVAELASSRTAVKKQHEADRVGQLEARRAQILEWFAPVLDCAQALKDNQEINHALHLHMANHTNKNDFRNHIEVEISSRSHYSAEDDRYIFRPSLSAKHDYKVLGVRVERFSKYSQDRNRPASENTLSVSEACALLMDRAADMIRHR